VPIKFLIYERTVISCRDKIASGNHRADPSLSPLPAPDGVATTQFGSITVQRCIVR